MLATAQDEAAVRGEVLVATHRAVGLTARAKLAWPEVIILEEAAGGANQLPAQFGAGHVAGQDPEGHPWAAGWQYGESIGGRI